MLKAYKYRIYPNTEQVLFFAKSFGCVRFIYNKMLHDRKESYEHYRANGGEKPKAPTPASYKGEFPFLKEVDSLSLANAQLNLNTAFKNFFREPSVGFPKFKSKKSNHFSYTTNNQGGTVSLSDRYLRLPKLKSLVRIKRHRGFQGLIKSVTISKTPSGKYFASLLVETEAIVPFPQSNTTVGLDLGIKDFCVASDGQVYANPKHLKKSEARLKKLQKDLSRKQKGSVNRNKARLRVAKLHERIANQRKDFLHKLSTKLIRENQSIVVESLKVKDMLQNKQLAKEISDASWSLFIGMLQYKSNWYHRNLLTADTYYASSQLCHVCGYKNTEVKDLSVRRWTCPKCHTKHDRDYNASKNLEAMASKAIAI